MKFRLGTRKSQLAQTQSQMVLEALQRLGVYCELVVIESEGDLNRKTPLYDMETLTPGLFTKQLETALLENKIDLAVHSLKDLPTEQPPQLIVAAITKREAAGDCVLVHQDRFSPNEVFHLPKNARVGTSSLRREAQLFSQRPDLEILPIRGNVPTRVDLVRRGEFDAIVLAQAGLNRLDLKLEGVRRINLSQTAFIPAPGQGALAVETRVNADPRLMQGIQNLNDPISEQETRVERMILKAMLGGCTLPLGVRCESDGKTLKCHSFLGVSAERKTAKHTWRSFHRFDISHTLEQGIISETVNYLKGQQNA